MKSHEVTTFPIFVSSNIYLVRVIFTCSWLSTSTPHSLLETQTQTGFGKQNVLSSFPAWNYFEPEAWYRGGHHCSLIITLFPLPCQVGSQKRDRREEKQRQESWVLLLGLAAFGLMLLQVLAGPSLLHLPR